MHAQMAFGRRLAPTVLGPVKRGCQQLDDGRIQHMNRTPEPMRHPRGTPPPEAGEVLLEVPQGLLEERPPKDTIAESCWRGPE